MLAAKWNCACLPASPTPLPEPRGYHGLSREGREVEATALHRLRFRLLLFVVVAACSWQSGMAQSIPPGGERLIHESWTFKDGAPESVEALAQTADGYLWLGTPYGLFRFDGRRFELFRSPFGEQLGSTNVSGLFAPATGGLWVGYRFGGFSFVKDGRVKNFIQPTGTVCCFAQDRRGAVWAASTRGVWRLDGSSWQPNPAEWSPGLSVDQLGLDRDGILWLLTDDKGPDLGRELFYLLPGGKEFKKAGDKLVTIGFTWDADNTVLTTPERRPQEPGSGIQLESSLPAYPILKRNAEQILDRANGLWVFLLTPTIFRHPAGEPLAAIVSQAEPGNSQAYELDPFRYARVVDREGSLWVGDPNGLHRFSYSPLMQPQLPDTRGHYFTAAPDQDGAVWISNGNGSEPSTLYHVSRDKVDIQKVQGDASVFGYPAPDKTFWFGGHGGLWHMVDRHATRIELPPDMADKTFGLVSATHDPTGGIWVTFGRAGLYRLRDGVWTSAGGRSDLPLGCVITFTDTMGRVWFGYPQNRVVVLDGDRAQPFGSNEGLEVGNVTAIFGKRSEIWIGGEFGLQQFDRGRFHTIHAIDKESLRGISGIVETANGDLWLNGLGGIVHLRRAEITQALKDPDYGVSGERFGRNAGLPGLPSQFGKWPTAIEGTDGRLWFTVNNAVVWLDPSRASNKAPPPPVAIESVSADDNGYGLDETLKFPARTSNVQIGYAAISLMDPEAIRYRYKLQEVDSIWHDVGTSTSVSYRNLSPGSYHFYVNASDTNGIWSGKIATVQFTVLPAFYQTNWFRALVAAFFLALLWGAYQWRLRQLHNQFEMTLNARVSERTRIARELHDTLLQSFHGLLLRFQTVSHLLPERPAEAKEKLDSAIDQAAEALTEGRDAVQGLRDSTIQNNDLALAINTVGQELVSESSDHCPAFRVAVEGESRNLHPILRDEIYKVAAEALRNAFRHAKARQIEVEIRYDDEQFRLRVRDDGKGIDAAVLSRQGSEGHYGLPGMRERATLIGGKLTVWSKAEAGTEVELCVPGSIAYATERGSWFSQKLAKSKS
jgi:signal transduction histidine kinase/ligand-binding sensor domain-containing protein